MEPYEIIVSPFDVYLAPVGEAFPAIEDTPGGNWGLLGANKGEYGEDGVTVTHEQSLFEHRGQATGPVKVARTEEGLKIAFMLHNLTLEKYGKVLNNAVPTDTPAGGGDAGFRDIDLHQGHSVSTWALLVRGPSGYGAGWNSQYQVPVVYQSASPAPVFSKGGAAGLEVEFTALEDPDAATEAEKFGQLVMQDADPAA